MSTRRWVRAVATLRAVAIFGVVLTAGLVPAPVLPPVAAQETDHITDQVTEQEAAQPEPTSACAGIIPADAPIRADTAQATSKKALGTTHAIATGRGINVAVIDTGVAPHPRLQPRLQPGSDLVDNTNSLFDCDGHGTIVAGIIAASPGADDYIGIAPEATIISIRQTSMYSRDTAGTLETLATAIHDALDHDAHVINISVVSCVPGHLRSHPGAPGLHEGLDAALLRAEHQGTVVVAATGNLNNECQPDSIIYPAHSPTVLAVSAYDEPHSLADYALPSSDAVLSAPGSAHVGLSPRLDAPEHVFAAGMTSPHGASPFVGTSFAAPVVAGVAALLRQRYPGDTPAQIRARITGSAEPGTGAVSPQRALTHIPASYQGETHRAQVTAPTPSDGRSTQRGALTVSVLALVVLGWVVARRVVALLITRQ